MTIPYPSLSRAGRRAIAEGRGGPHDDDPGPADPWGDDVPPPDESFDDEQEVDSWAPVDLGPYLRGEIIRSEPSVGIARRDGLHLLYPGKEHAVVGEMESGKSWFCLASAAAEMTAGRTVVYVHFEEADPGGTIDGLRALGVDPYTLTERFLFVGPERRVTPDALAALLDRVPSLVILDGVNEALSLHGWDGNATDGAAMFRRHLVKPCTRAGAATLAADHVVKDAERRGRSAIGSVHKVNGLSGALILLENAEPFGRCQRGRSHVFVTKDRPGNLRKEGRPSAVVGKTYMGELVVDDTQSRGPDLSVRFYPLKGDQADDEVVSEGPTVADEVHAVLAALPGRVVASERTLYAEMRQAGHSLREKAIRDALDDLVAAGRVNETSGKRGARGYEALTAAQAHKPATAARTAAATAAPLEGDRWAAVAVTAAGRSGPQSAADVETAPNDEQEATS